MITIIATLLVLSGGAERGPLSLTPDCTVENFGGFEIAPSFLDSFAVDYPEMARRARIEGQVKLRIYVNSNGELACVKIIERFHPILDKRAMVAAKYSKYQPAEAGGKPVNGYFDVNYNFNLSSWAKDMGVKVRDKKPPVDLVPPMISQLGIRTNSDERFPKYEYRGVGFAGDVSLRVYEECLGQISDKLRGPEIPYWVVHRLVWPTTKPNDYITKGDLEIKTCEKGCEPNRHGRGRVFKFVNENGNYVLVETPGVEINWIE